MMNMVVDALASANRRSGEPKRHFTNVHFIAHPWY